MKARKLIFFYCTAFFLFVVNQLFAQVRQVISINDNWEFKFAYNVLKDAIATRVTLPHTWNANEVMPGRMNYLRTMGTYTRQLNIPADYKGKRLFLRFEGANSVATVLLNQKYVSEHRGGYTAFCVEITNHVTYGQDNLLTVQVNNSIDNTVLPLSGDFNIYGGLHRAVSLLVTNPNCITPLDYASPGVYLLQKNVSATSADLEVTTKLALQEISNHAIVTTILDKTGQVVSRQTTEITGQPDKVTQNFKIQKPHLWNGKKDPYLYRVTVALTESGKAIDEVSQPLGLRYFKVDPDKGFFLNGQYLDLRGVCRHQDVMGKGSALTTEDHDRDLADLEELGATSLRLTHYPHSEYFYEGCNKQGLVLWTEIPLVGPGGYTGAGYIKHPRLEAHARQLVVEMIRQHFNNPSICFWGLFNELKLDYDDPAPFIKELHALVKQEDPSRLTTCASQLDTDHFNQVTDVIAWNKYFGWYGGKAEGMSKWADDMHRHFPKIAIGISEYGAGGSARQHQSGSLVAPNPSGRFHPEEWQAYYHEKNWEILQQRPFIWGKYIWVLKDFGSSIRSEGDTTGINDKGLITYNGKIKKDAFYFYKANWNPTPMVYITERRDYQRKEAITQVKIYCNLPQAELYINGKSMGKRAPDTYKIAVWENLSLKPGENDIEVQAQNDRHKVKDSCKWKLVNSNENTLE